MSMFESEERRIVRRIKDFIKNEEYFESVNIYTILRNRLILDIDNYREMVISGKINPQDAYVYFDRNWTSYKSTFHYPFLEFYDILLDAHLSKFGFHYRTIVVPATGLKYVALVISYKEYLSMEVVNLDTVANSTDPRTITSKVLGEKLITGEKELTNGEYFEIRDMFRSQRLFAGHNFEEALDIISKYYDDGKRSLAKEVARIAMDYYRIFQPYTVCYDIKTSYGIKTWKEIDCSTIT